MAGHTSEKRWDKNQFGDVGVGEIVKNAALQMVFAMDMGEAAYEDLLELWDFAGGTDQLLADQLFREIWSVRETVPGTPDTQANPQEMGQVADARATMLAIHELYEALTNVAVTQANRIATLRRMT